MKKIALVGFILFMLPVQLIFSQQQEEWGIASQYFYQRYYDRTFDVNFQSYSARALGMGNAVISTANNVDAIAWNPACLALLTRPEASIVSYANFDTREYFSPEFSGIKILSDPLPNFLLNSGAIAYPLKFGGMSIVPGLSYRYLYSMGKKFDETQYSYGGGLFKEEKEFSGGPRAISPALAFSIIPQISVGMTYNHVMGSSKYILKIKSPWADNRVYFGFEDQEDYSGSFFNFGLNLKPIRFLSLGFTVTPGWTYSIQEKKEQFRLIDFDYELGWIEAIYETSAEFLNEYKIEIPLVYRAGLAIHPLKNLSLAFDYESIKWEAAKITSEGKEHPNYMVNVENLRVGFEYRISYKLWEVPLRLGYFTDDLPYKDQWFQTQYLGEQIKREFFTFGLGIYHGHYLVDFAYMYGQQSCKWWMRKADYYNERIFETKDMMNQAVFSFSYRL